MPEGPGFIADTLARDLRSLPLPGRLASVRERIDGRLVFTTSFGLEDQAITHAICEAGIEVELATLDTGRLFPETYDVWAQTESRYGLRIRAFLPDRDSLERLLEQQGVEGFRRSVEARKACCLVRKVEPLRRALAGARGWVTGLRAEQSSERQTTPFAVFDEVHGLIKANPLADWSRDSLVSYIEARRIPYNALHDRGFPSIGCAPCTRAVRPSEPERAGRWWWEDEAKKECGLHLRPVAQPRAAELA